MVDDDSTREPETDDSASGYVVVVLDKRAHDAHALPDRGAIAIGRAETAALHIDRPWISRAHAILHMGPPLVIEDLGSPNRVRVGGEVLASGEKRVIQVNDVIVLGTTMLVVQRRTVGDGAHPALALPEFLIRVDEDCERARRLGLVVEVVALIADAGAEWTVRSALAATHSLSVLAVQPRGPFLVASIRKRSASKKAQASSLADRLEDVLRSRGVTVRIGAATFPDDGTGASGLAQVANERALARPHSLRPGALAPQPLHDEVAALEHQRVLAALESCGWNQSHAAKKLGIARNTLISRMKIFGITAGTGDCGDGGGGAK